MSMAWSPLHLKPAGASRPGHAKTDIESGSSGTVASMHMRMARMAGIGLIVIASFLSLVPDGHRKKSEERASAAMRQPSAREPATVPPPVAPVTFEQVTHQDAQALNRVTPFVPPGPDRPIAFHVDKASESYGRALDCLASALLYEAGDTRKGQAAVAQVVLNRVRHPAFPHSVCGVVYQGSERTSGCQFTFTCDGALARIPTPAMWRRARETAAAFLAGETDPAVGMATHYHTDWVRPYWSPALDKVAQVDTHLFFRWRGGWGRRRAFDAVYTGAETYQRQLTLISAAHRTTTDKPGTALSTATENDTQPDPAGGTMLTLQEGDHFILVDGGGDGTRLAMQGLGECAGQAYCKVVGWDRHSRAYGSPSKPIIRTVAFLYVSDKRTGVEIVLWDCTRFNRPSDSQCLSAQNRRWITFKGDFSHAS